MKMHVPIAVMFCFLCNLAPVRADQAKINGHIPLAEWQFAIPEIGVLLLSSLKQQTYWVVTEPLLTTNTEEEVLDTVVSPPFPFGPGYANTYKIEYFKERLLQLKTQRPDDNLDLILSGEDSRGYSDYLKHPHAYGY